MRETSPRQHIWCGHTKYKLSCRQFDLLRAEVNYRCQICGTEEHETKHGRLAIDHDPELGFWAVRGVLCQPCNSLLGRGLLPEDAAARFLADPWHKRVGIVGPEIVEIHIPHVAVSEAIEILHSAKRVYLEAKDRASLKAARERMKNAVRIAAKSGLRQRDIVKAVDHVWLREQVYIALHEDGRRVA